MKRVLFVDDEPRVLQGIENLLFDLYEDWDVTTVDNGLDALLRLREHRYDVMVTDMRMPGMDGPTLLEQVRAQFPDVALFVLSGDADQTAIVSTLGSIHRFLAKPCNGPHLIDTLKKTSGFLDQISSNVKRRVGRATRLPSASTFTMAGCGTTRAELVTKVESDATAALLILRAADTLLKGEAGTLEIGVAVDRLGVDLTHSILSSMEPPSAFDGIDQEIVDDMHLHGRLVAECARALSGDAAWKETAYITGLVYDIAHLVSYSVDPESFVTMDENARGELGATVLGLWGFRQEVIEVVKEHHDLEKACTSYPSVMSSVILAECIAFSVLEDKPCPVTKYFSNEVLTPLRETVQAVIKRLQNETAENPVC